jgi:hypothetical protein
MALATSTAIALALAAASAGTSYYNTQRTAKNADQAMATQIRNQGAKQRQADAKVNDEVTKLGQSTAEKSRREGLDSYMQALLAGKSKLHEGLGGDYGSKAFQQGADRANANVDQYAGDTAGLLARMDAPGQQRQDEAFGYGRLATDLGLIGREAQGQNFIDQLLVQRASRRNPWLDALSAGLGGAASAGFGASGGGIGGGVAGTQGGVAGTGRLHFPQG